MADSSLSTTEQVSTIWNLGGLTFRQLVKKIVTGINQDNLTGRAAELAFNFVLALFPLFIFLLSVIGLFAARGSALRHDLFGYVYQFLPPAASQVIANTLNEVMQNASNGKLTFGIVLTVWFASGGMSSLISTLNEVYRVKERRSWIKPTPSSRYQSRSITRTLGSGLPSSVSSSEGPISALNTSC